MLRIQRDETEHEVPVSYLIDEGKRRKLKMVVSLSML